LHAIAQVMQPRSDGRSTDGVPSLAEGFGQLACTFTRPS
jgi:hypothetical protein